MIQSPKKLQELSELINKDNKNIISQAIDLLRNENPFEGAIGILTEYFDKTDDITIKKSIELFMNDLKDQSSAGEVIAEIRKEWKPETISMLVSSCWQSGLDYSEYSVDMANIFMKGDYVTAIECLTVIEESVHMLNKDTKDEIIKIIDINHMAHRKEKAELTDELLAILMR
jgi:hypothetical protein